MRHTISLVRRVIRVQSLPLLALGAGVIACNSADRMAGTSEPPARPAPAGPLFAGSFAGGIPFGTFALPTQKFGNLFNGALRNIWPKYLLRELATIKAQGGRVVLMFAGNERHYKGSEGHFSFTQWKNEVDEFKGVDFSSFVEDGTIIGHYLIDEPNDPFNWNGEPIPGSTVEAMAEYSKQLWPNLPTIVRTEPGYLARTGGPYRYLDAAWAQYVSRKGTADDYIRRNVGDAEKLGLGLITGLNTSLGGPGGSPMSATLIETAGSALLANSYPCAFISWKYDEKVVERSDVQQAMERLSTKAREHSAKSCRAGSAGPPPPPPPPPPPSPTNQPPSAAFDPPSCRAGSSCSFTDRSSDTDGTIVTRVWSFGPGTTSAESNPSTTFASAGSYKVTLVVTDDDGATGSLSQDVVVTSQNNKPVAAFASPPCISGVPCQFSDGSSDSDGQVATRSWAFGDGATSAEANPATTYSAGGLYAVTLTVTDNEGATSALTQDVRVDAANRAPTAAFAAPKCLAGVPCQLTDGSGDSDGNIASRSWVLGNGTSSAEANPSVTYATAGSYRITLTVTDNLGATGSVSRTLKVKPGSLPGSTPIALGLSTLVRNNRRYLWLSWSGASGAAVDVYRDNVLREKTKNDGKYIRSPRFRGGRPYSFKICEQATSRCSNTVIATPN